MKFSTIPHTDVLHLFFPPPLPLLSFPLLCHHLQNEHAEHAFILRRYDTGAISVTTMYKAAFPTASQEEEDREMRWVSLCGICAVLVLGWTCDRLAKWS